MTGLRRLLRNNGLSLAFVLLFVGSFVGQTLLGRAAEGHPPGASGLWAFLVSPKFLEGIFVNWQAALLQLATLVLFAAVLRQRGSSHSRKPTVEQGETSEPMRQVPHPGGAWVYRHSLSLALFGCTLLAFVAFVFADRALDADQHRAAGAGVPSWPAFLLSAKLWFDVLQTWQAEFFAMAFFLPATVFLREEDSAESKPVEAADDVTGETNS